MRHENLDTLELRDGRVPVFAGLRFATPWSLFDRVEIAPGASIEIPGDSPCKQGYSPCKQGYSPCKQGYSPCEQGYAVLEGQVELTAGSPENPPLLSGCHAPGPGAILAPVGRAHSLINLSQRSARLLHVRVEMEILPADPSVRVADIDPKTLTWRDAIHGGAGRIATRHIWEPADFASSWTFLDHAVLAPDSSVGYHYHDALEESFVVLDGQGYMTIADRTMAVAPGSATFQAIGEGHGIYNPGPGELEFLRIAVGLPGEPFTTIDLHDDLSGRCPV